MNDTTWSKFLAGILPDQRHLVVEGLKHIAATGKGALLPSKAQLFIGSSTARLPLARSLCVALDADARCRVWADGTFTPGSVTLDALIRETKRCDFALFVLGSDDLVHLNCAVDGGLHGQPRDNVIFEAGLFMGAIGRERVFLAVDASAPHGKPRILSDVSGVTYLTLNADPDPGVAVGAVAEQVRREIRRLRSAPRNQSFESIEECHDAMLHVMALPSTRAMYQISISQPARFPSGRHGDRFSAALNDFVMSDRELHYTYAPEIGARESRRVIRARHLVSLGRPGVSVRQIKGDPPMELPTAIAIGSEHTFSCTQVPAISRAERI